MKEKEPIKLNHVINRDDKPLKIKDAKTSEVKINPEGVINKDRLKGPKLEQQRKFADVAYTDDKSPKCRDSEADGIKAPSAHSTPQYKKHKDRPKPFACDQCPFKTAHKKNLLTHIKIMHEKSMKDEKEKCFYCNQCSFKTVYRQNLLPHIRSVHDKVKRDRGDACLACDRCSFTTLYKWNLKNHIKGLHM